MLKSAFYFALGMALALLALVAIALVVAGCAGDDPVTAPSPTAQPTPTSAPLMNMGRDLEIVTLLHKDAIPAILEPEFLTMAKANEQMTDDELVIGLFIEGDSRAYSVNMLSRHEIVNDVVGGKPAAVTW